uniref:Uncharacterized protein n=1 Tax=Taeniopygia guttata TaxID=59729 RepID=A0A674HHL0_TAEGU
MGCVLNFLVVCLLLTLALSLGKDLNGNRLESIYHLGKRITKLDHIFLNGNNITMVSYYC